MKKLLMIVLVAALFSPLCAPKARAIDPVTMAILAPVALRVAEAAKPYVIKGAAGTCLGLFKIGKAAFQMLYLPWGVLEMTVGAPFHKFKSGVKHVIRGGVYAPARVLMYTLVLPLYMVGAEMNR